MKLSELKRLVLEVESYFDSISNTQPSGVQILNLEYDVLSFGFDSTDHKGNEITVKVKIEK